MLVYRIVHIVYNFSETTTIMLHCSNPLMRQNRQGKDDKVRRKMMLKTILDATRHGTLNEVAG
jgi:hypothetical protein